VEAGSTKVSRSSKGTSHRFIQVELLQGRLVESTRCFGGGSACTCENKVTRDRNLGGLSRPDIVPRLPQKRRNARGASIARLIARMKPFLRR
jgi:hypothetical protein